MTRARITFPPPPTIPPFPAWARLRGMPKTPEDAGFLAGAAFAALHPIACHDHPIGSLWRQRLALTNAAVLARHAGRTEDEAALRDAWYLRRPGDDPGPAGRVLQAWRRLAEHDPLDKAIRLVLRPKDWMADLTNALDVPLDAALEDVGDAARKLAAGEGSAIAAAAAVAAVSLQKRPDAEALALWLADAVLAHRLKWPAPVPLIAGQIRRSDFRAAARPDGEGAWQTSWTLAYARAAAAAADLYAELARRAHQLLTAAPKLRGRDAARRVEILLTEDAQAATAGARATDRSSRRLFDRLVAIGAACLVRILIDAMISMHKVNMHDWLLHTLGLVSASWKHHSAGAAPLDQEFGPSILYPIYGPMRWSSVLPRTLMAPPNGSVKLDHEPFAEEG